MVKIRHFSDYVLGISAGWDGAGLNPFTDYITQGIETVNVYGHYDPQIRLKVYSIKGRGMDLNFTIASEDDSTKLGGIAPGLKLDLPFLLIEYENYSTYTMNKGSEIHISIPGKGHYSVNKRINPTSSGSGSLAGWNVYNFNSNSFAVKVKKTAYYLTEEGPDICYNVYEPVVYLSDGRCIRDYGTYQTVTDPNGNMIKYTYHTKHYKVWEDGGDSADIDIGPDKTLIDTIEDTMGRMFYFTYNSDGNITKIQQKLLDNSMKTILTCSYSGKQIIITDAVGRAYTLNYNINSEYQNLVWRKLLGISYPNGVNSKYKYNTIDYRSIRSDVQITSQKWYKPNQSNAFREVTYNRVHVNEEVDLRYATVKDGITKKEYQFSDNGSVLTEKVYSIASGKLLKEIANQYATLLSGTIYTGERYGSELLTSNATTLYKNSDSTAGGAITWQYEYDNWGNITKVIDPKGTEMVMAYANTNCNQNLATITETRLGEIKTTTVSRKKLSKRIKSLKRSGATNISYVRSGSSYIISYQETYQVAKGYQNSLYTTGAAWNQIISKATLITDAVHGTTQLKQTHYQYDATTGNLLQESEVSNGGYLNTSYTYDSYGNMLTKTDANGNTLNFEYAATTDQPYQSAYLTKVTTSDETTVATFDYNVDTGNKTKATDPKGNIYRYEYDAIGRPTREYLDNSDSVVGIARILDYDDTDNILTMLYGNNSARYQAGRITYDPLFGKPTELQRYNSLVTGLSDLSDSNWVTQKKYTYDSNGRAVTETDALNYTRAYTYDALDRKTLITRPDATTTQFVYDDRTVTTTDANGNVKKQTYDLLDRLVAVTECPNSSETYTSTYVYDSFYDNSGGKPLYHLLTATNPLGAVTTNTYDNLGRLSRTDYPQDGTNPLTAETFTYDSVGNLLTKTNGKGTKSLNYEYFTGYRLKTVTEPDGRIVSYTYDANDNPLTQSWDTGSYTYSYDARNRVTQNIAHLDGYSFVTAYAYDAFGRVTSIAYPGRTSTVNYTYDVLDRLQTIPGFVTACSYDEANKLTNITMANGISTTYTYDSNDRPTAIGLGGMLNLSYSYDSVGNITQINDDYYGYDGTNRLIWYGKLPYAQKARATGISWTYDGAGNMTAKETYLTGASQGSVAFSYDLANRLWSMGITTYTNDSAGARIAKVQNANNWVYTYDGETRLTQVDKNGAIQVQCTYDGGGMRYKKVENGKTVYCLYSGVNPLMEYSPSDGKYTYRIYAGKQAVAEEAGSVVKYYHKDHLGSTRLITDNSGNVLRRNDFDPYGNPINPLLFPEDGSFEKCSITKINGDLQFSNGVNNVAVGAKWRLAMHYSPSDEYIEICNSDNAANRSKVGRLYDNGSGTWKAIYSSATIKLKPEKWYRISVKARAVSNFGAKKAMAYLSYNSNDAVSNKLVTKLVNWTASELAAGNWVRKYVIFQVPSGCTDTSVAAYFYGHLGTGIVEYDDYVIEEFDSQPTGEPVDEKNEFTGKRGVDSPSELYYFGARFYDPEVGRFITQDTYTNLPNDERNFFITADGSFMPRSHDPAKYNRYAYCQDNPINRVDPDGHFAFLIALTPEMIQAGIMGIGAVVATYENIKGMIKNAEKSTRNYHQQTREQLEKSKRSYEKLIHEHKEKLDQYTKNPAKHDNKGLLDKVSREIRDKIINGRINELKSQIAKQEKELDKIKEALDDLNDSKTDDLNDSGDSEDSKN
jgi:RHS repeat-associated protein